MALFIFSAGAEIVYHSYQHVTCSEGAHLILPEVVTQLIVCTLELPYKDHSRMKRFMKAGYFGMRMVCNTSSSDCVSDHIKILVVEDQFANPWGGL